jgi:3alpha(or 20beta)-hydroxysteroid dehydrogenase
VGRLDGKVALITGGAKGQGAAEAKLFRAEGAEVWVVDIDDARGKATAAEIGATYRHLDVRDEAAWGSLVEDIVAAHGRLDTLVNNAGIFTYARLTETSVDDFTRQFDVNQLGVFLGMRAVAPTMIEARRGSIVNISSAAGLVGMANTIGYTATKWAVRGMTKSAALELGRFGVRVNSIHPGVIDTELLYENPVMRREDLTPVLRSVPLGRMAQPVEVATVALFLASEDASYCTGGEFAVDGGVTAS